MATFSGKLFLSIPDDSCIFASKQTCEKYSIIKKERKSVTIHHAMKRCNVYPESGDTIPIKKTKTNWVMSPVSYQLIRYSVPDQTQFW